MNLRPCRDRDWRAAPARFSRSSPDHPDLPSRVSSRRDCRAQIAWIGAIELMPIALPLIVGVVNAAAARACASSREIRARSAKAYPCSRHEDSGFRLRSSSGGADASRWRMLGELDGKYKIAVPPRHLNSAAKQRNRVGRRHADLGKVNSYWLGHNSLRASAAWRHDILRNTSMIGATWS